MIEKNDLFIIAEIGVNHEGNILEGKKLIRLAKKGGADAVKLQVYTPWRYSCSDDKERLERLKKFYISKDDFLSLKEEAEKHNIILFSSMLSEDWVDFLSQHTQILKIASGDLTFKPLIEAVAKTGKKTIMSTGSSTLKEIEEAIQWFKENSIYENDINKQLTLMHCVSSYPTPIEQANIKSIPFLKEKFNLNVGYSNHVIGMNASLAAVALGARVIELHFTDQKHDREFRDHSLSFEFEEILRFKESAINIIKSLGKFNKMVMDVEKDNLKLIRKGLIASKDLDINHEITEDDIAYARPAKYFSSNEISLILGKKTKTIIKKGFVFKDDNLK